MLRIILSKTLTSISYLHLLVIFLLVAFIGTGYNQAFAKNQTTRVQIECKASDADFVTLIWGFNGWKTPKDFQPDSRTKIDEDAYRTPMVKQGDSFIIELDMPTGKVLNWGLLMGKKNAPKSKFFDQKYILIDSSMSPLVIKEELVASNEELGYETTSMNVKLALIGVFLFVGLLFIFSGLGKSFGFEPYGDYRLRVPMSNQFTYGLLITIAVIHIVVLIGSAGFIHYIRQIEGGWENGGPIKILLAQFSLARENNVAVWYSAMVFLLTGLVALLAFWGVYNVRDNKVQIRTAWGWLLLSALFVALSADELGSIHERLGMLKELNPTGNGALRWTDLFAIPGAIIGIFMVWFFFQNFRRQKRSFFLLLLGVTALISLFFQENVEFASIKAAANPETWQRPIWQIILEEGSELVAIWCFLAAFVNLVHRLSLQKSLQNSLAAPEVSIPVKPAILVGLSFCLVSFSVLGTGILSPMIQFGIEGGDNGITSNWFPSMLAFVGAVLSWLVWNAEKKNKHFEYLILALVLLALSMYYGAALRTWFSKEGPHFPVLVFFEVLLLLGVLFFTFRVVINYKNWWQIIFYSIWGIGLAIAFFIPEEFTGMRDIWPFSFLLPILITQWMEKAD